MRTVTTQLSQRVETLMELPPPEPRRRPSPPGRPSRPGAGRPPPCPAGAGAPADVAGFDLKLGDFAAMINNIEVRGMRAGRRWPATRWSSASPGRGTVGRRGSAPKRAGTAAARRDRPSAWRDGPGARCNGAVPGVTVPVPGVTGTVPGVSSPVPGVARRSRLRRGQRRSPQRDRRRRGAEDPKRIRIDLRQVRREIFDELVADRAAFDALPLEEKQRVFAEIDQRMPGVAQGIKVLQQELASRAVDVRTQDATSAAAAAAGAAGAARAATVPPRSVASAPPPNRARYRRTVAPPVPQRAAREAPAGDPYSSRGAPHRPRRAAAPR